MSSTILLPILATLLAQSGVEAAYGDACCPTKTVTNSPGAPELDGEYTLKEDEGSAREAICIDGCIYTKDDSGDEYCFIEKPLPESADVVCEGESSGSPPPSGGSTEPGSPPPSGESTELSGPTGDSSPPPSDGSTSPGTGSPPPSDGSTSPGTGSPPPSDGSTSPGTGGPSDGSTSPPPTGGSSEPSSGSPGSTTEAGYTAPGGSTSPATGGSTTAESADSLKATADAAAAEKARAQQAIADAEAEKAAAESAGAALDDVANLLAGLTEATTVASTTAAYGGRKKRQDTTAFVPVKPTSCSEFGDAVAQISDLLATNPLNAVALIDVLKTVTSADFTCSAADVAAISSNVDAAKEKATAVVAEKQNEIAAETAKFNEAIALIEETNAKLVAIGEPTADPGTPLPTVATVPVPTTIPGTGASSPDGSSPASSPEGSSPPASSPASSPEGSSPPASTPPMSTAAPGGRRARGVYLKHFGIEI